MQQVRFWRKHHRNGSKWKDCTFCFKTDGCNHLERVPRSCWANRQLHISGWLEKGRGVYKTICASDPKSCETKLMKHVGSDVDSWQRFHVVISHTGAAGEKDMQIHTGRVQSKGTVSPAVRLCKAATSAHLRSLCIWSVKAFVILCEVKYGNQFWHLQEQFRMACTDKFKAAENFTKSQGKT